MKTSDLLKNYWAEPSKIEELRVGFGEPVEYPMWKSYIGMVIHPDMMSVLSRVIFPVFIEFDGCVILHMNTGGYSEEDLINCRREYSSNMDFEESFNILKIYDLFSRNDVEHVSSYEQVACLLKLSWELTLKRIFPEKSFKIILNNSGSGTGPILTFCTKTTVL